MSTNPLRVFASFAYAFNRKTMLFAAALAVASTQTSWATEYVINISGTFEKEVFFPEAFGSTDTSLPVSGTIVIEDAGLTTYPAGTVFTNFTGGTSARDLVGVPASAVKSLSITIGYATWSASDLLTYPQYFLGHTLLIEGSLTSPSNSLAGLLVESGVGNANFSSFACETSSCSLQTVGSAVDNFNNSFGSISGLSATISVVPPPVFWQLTVSTNGPGSVAFDPPGTVHTNNLVVSLTATPAPNYAFTGWSGDAAGTNNPLSVTMTTNKVIAANFQFVTNTTTTMIELAARIGWLAETNKNYQVQGASVLDTNNWVNLGEIIPGNGTTNYYVDPIGGSEKRFYRVITQP